MKSILKIAGRIDALNAGIGRILIWLVLAMVLVSAGNAIARYLLNQSSNAWLELQWYLFSAVFLLCAGYTLLNDEHIRIDVVYGAFSRRVQHWIDLFGHIFFLMPFVLLMVWYFVPYVGLSWRSGEMSNNAGGLILWPAKLLVLAGFVLLAAQAISEIIKRALIVAGRIPDETPAEAPLLSGEALHPFRPNDEANS